MSWALWNLELFWWFLGLLKGLLNEVVALSWLSLVLGYSVNPLVFRVFRLLPDFGYFWVHIRHSVVDGPVLVPLSEWSLQTSPTGCINEATELF